MSIKTAKVTASEGCALSIKTHDVAKFNELAAPVEAKQEAPWLRRWTDANGVEENRVVDLERRIERLATPEETEHGVFYSSYDEYKQRRVA